MHSDQRRGQRKEEGSLKLNKFSDYNFAIGRHRIQNVSNGGKRNTISLTAGQLGSFFPRIIASFPQELDTAQEGAA